MYVTLLSSHRILPPFCLAVGCADEPGMNQLILAKGVVKSLPGSTQFKVSQGDVLVVAPHGGGVYEG